MSVVLFCSLIFSANIFAQNTETDSAILNLLAERKAFLLWQREWQQHLPDFDFRQFKLYSEKEIEKNHEIGIGRLRFHPLLIFSPNGQKALNGWAGAEIYQKNGKYKLGFDDSGHMRLFDFKIDTSYQVLFTGSYAPWIRGVAWLDDDLFVAVGEIHDLSGSQDKIAPAVLLFDLSNMKIRTFSGEFIYTKEYHKKRLSPPPKLIEQRLIFH